MDAYLGYNKINMGPLNSLKMTFMSNHNDYYYNVIPFGLKNTCATYQRHMDVVFSQQIGNILAVYVDDMILKTSKEHSHAVDLEDVLESVRKYNMRLNPAKCSFWGASGKAL